MLGERFCPQPLPMELLVIDSDQRSRNRWVETISQPIARTTSRQGGAEASPQQITELVEGYQGLSPDDIVQAHRHYAEGWSLARIDDRLNADAHTIRRALKARGVRIRDPHARERWLDSRSELTIGGACGPRPTGVHRPNEVGP